MQRNCSCQNPNYKLWAHNLWAVQIVCRKSWKDNLFVLEWSEDRERDVQIKILLLYGLIRRSNYTQTMMSKYNKWTKINLYVYNTSLRPNLVFNRILVITSIRKTKIYRKSERDFNFHWNWNEYSARFSDLVLGLVQGLPCAKLPVCNNSSHNIFCTVFWRYLCTGFHKSSMIHMADRPNYHV